MAFKKKSSSEGRGIILFERVEEALKAERLLREAGYACKLIAPPPALRRGCDLALEINLVEQMGIERLLKERDVNYLEITSLKGRATELSGIVKVIDFGEAVMVKAANMKLTFDKKTGLILNASGGGCPDIPYLHLQLLGKRLSEAPRPRDIGFTLCGLMLDRALEEGQRLWEGGKNER